MTLNEKFDKATDGWIVADKCEEIADEFAVEFAEWVLSRSLGETVQLKDDTLSKFKFVKGL